MDVTSTNIVRSGDHAHEPLGLQILGRTLRLTTHDLNGRLLFQIKIKVPLKIEENLPPVVLAAKTKGELSFRTLLATSRSCNNTRNAGEYPAFSYVFFDVKFYTTVSQISLHPENCSISDLVLYRIPNKLSSVSHLVYKVIIL